MQLFRGRGEGFGARESQNRQVKVGETNFLSNVSLPIFFPAVAPTNSAGVSEDVASNSFDLSFRVGEG